MWTSSMELMQGDSGYCWCEDPGTGDDAQILMVIADSSAICEWWLTASLWISIVADWSSIIDSTTEEAIIESAWLVLETPLSARVITFL